MNSTLNEAARLLRRKGYSVQDLRIGGGLVRLIVTAPYSRDVFEAVYANPEDAGSALLAMEFAAPPLFVDPDFVPTSAEVEEAERRAEHLAARTASRLEAEDA